MLKDPGGVVVAAGPGPNRFTQAMLNVYVCPATNACAAPSVTLVAFAAIDADGTAVAAVQVATYPGRATPPVSRGVVHARFQFAPPPLAAVKFAGGPGGPSGVATAATDCEPLPA